MNFIKNNFLFLIIFLLFLLIILGRIIKPKVIETIVVKRDTIWITKDSVVYSHPQIINSIRGEIEYKYLPDTNYNKLVKQYRDLLVLYFSKTIQKDTLTIPNLGIVSITDSVSQNSIKDREYIYTLKYPLIKETTILPSRFQLYVGGGIAGSQGYLVNQINAGVLIKNKKDQIYGVYSGINKDGQVQFGVSTYFKIRLR